MGNLKLVSTGLSRISGAKGDLCLRFSPASSFDLVTSFCTSSSRSFTGCSAPAGCAPSRGVKRSISPGRSKGSRIGPREDLVPLGHVRLALSYLTSRQLPIVGGTVRWSVAVSALTRCPSLAVRGQGYYLSIDCCVCLDTLPIASCQGSWGIVRRSVVTSTLTRRLSPTVEGQGHWSRASLARRLCCATRYQGG
ncbi:hypothetical protein B296_00055814 [Ensete ventricosum]|uniref:Uncharacterized protein n=1 Tax=Ensete ventricosum TaxID=4639 RepID=A0A426X1D8_ENSVE|nr:hypothetical protein B296_00055814 [Ensete ventricosum]